MPHPLDGQIRDLSMARTLPTDIARQLNLKVDTVYNVLRRLRRNGAKIPRLAPKHIQRAPATLEILRLALDGVGPTVISKRVGMDRRKVLEVIRRLRKAGYTLPYHVGDRPRSGRDMAIVRVPTAAVAAYRTAGEEFDLSAEQAVRRIVEAVAASPPLLRNLLDPEA